MVKLSRIFNIGRACVWGHFLPRISRRVSWEFPVWFHFAILSYQRYEPGKFRWRICFCFKMIKPRTWKIGQFREYYRLCENILSPAAVSYKFVRSYTPWSHSLTNLFSPTSCCSVLCATVSLLITLSSDRHPVSASLYVTVYPIVIRPQKNHKNRNITTADWQIFAKFGTIMQNGFLNRPHR